MNPNKQKRKLTLVSLYCNGKQVSMFLYLPVCDDGKVRVDTKIYNVVNARRGDTVSFGL